MDVLFLEAKESYVTFDVASPASAGKKERRGIKPLGLRSSLSFYLLSAFYKEY